LNYFKTISCGGRVNLPGGAEILRMEPEKMRRSLKKFNFEAINQRRVVQSLVWKMTMHTGVLEY